MLLEFRISDYKSFTDEVVFSMIPAPKQKGLDFSVSRVKIGTKVHKALCSAVIYGPNASGKTNLIGAMEVFKTIVLRGHIRNGTGEKEPNLAVNRLELIPNALGSDPKPTRFAVKFIESGLLLDYRLTLDLGAFLEEQHKRKIVSEELLVNEKTIFSRGKELDFGDLGVIKDFWVNQFEDSAASASALAKNNMNDEELFLKNGFKTMFSSKLVDIISSWFEHKFVVVYRADAVESVLNSTIFKKKTVYVDERMNEAIKIFGVKSNRVGILFDEDTSQPTRISIFDNHNGLAAEAFESYGTIRFLNMFPLIASVLLNGGTLVVDEFDASLHPMAIMSLVNVFHNNDVNTNHAQLVFNTHNPIFLNSNLFRRDEIKFVERDDMTHSSIHYSLSDFGTSGARGVRKHEDYMKNYFVSQYGAIKDVDFTPVFEELLSSGDGETDGQDKDA